MKIVAAVLLFVLSFPALSDQLDEARVQQLRQQYAVDIDRVLNPDRAARERMQRLLLRGLAGQASRPQPSLTERMDEIYGHDHTHSRRPARGIYIDGGSYLIGPDFMCTKSGNVTICN